MGDLYNYYMAAPVRDEQIERLKTLFLKYE
jgi:hypothetical protein